MVVQEIADEIGSVPCCQACGSERVARDAWACFNPEFGLWELEMAFERAQALFFRGVR